MAVIDLNEGRAEGWPAITEVLQALLVDALLSDARRIVLLAAAWRWPRRTGRLARGAIRSC